MLLFRNNFAHAFCLLTVSCVPCLGQTPVNFSTITSVSDSPSTPHAVDVNGDGTPDIVQVTQLQQGQFGYSVSMAKGDGSFAAPVGYSFPSAAVPGPLAFADLNGDGNVDMILTLTGGADNQIAVYLGNGDGTFQQPKFSTINLPSGDAFEGSPLVTADFNHDGKIDVAAVAGYTGGAGGALVVLEGDGQGGLTNGGTIFSLPDVPFGTYFDQIVTGDFDSDNNADIALTTNEACDSGAVGNCYVTAHVLYGNGAFGFEDRTVYSTTGNFNLSSGDLNGDGRTDLFGVEVAASTNQVPSQLIVLYGQTDRTFDTYSYSGIPSSIPGSSYGVGTLAMADFNGDGRMDLVGYDTGYLTGSGFYSQLTFFLAGANPGEFITQNVTVPVSYNTDVVVGDFNEDKKPDAAIVQQQGSTPLGAIVTAVNQTSGGYYGSCAYPKMGQGISLCAPIGPSNGGQVAFSAAANSFGQIRKFELWIDGKKIADDYHSWGNRAYFDLSTSLLVGSHYATLNLTTIDNDAEDYNLRFTINP